MYSRVSCENLKTNFALILPLDFQRLDALRTFEACKNDNYKKVGILSEVILCLAWKFNSDILSQFQNTTKSKWNSVGKTLVGIAVWTENQKTRLKFSENIDLKQMKKS